MLGSARFGQELPQGHPKAEAVRQDLRRRCRGGDRHLARDVRTRQDRHCRSQLGHGDRHRARGTLSAKDRRVRRAGRVRRRRRKRGGIIQLLRARGGAARRQNGVEKTRRHRARGRQISLRQGDDDPTQLSVQVRRRHIQKARRHVQVAAAAAAQDKGIFAVRHR